MENVTKLFSSLDTNILSRVSPLVAKQENEIRQETFQLTDPEVQKPWEFYASSFSKNLRGSDDWSNIHLSVVQNYLDWDHPDHGLFYFLQFANQIPLWQGRYATSASSFHEAYRLLVYSYAIEYEADPNLQALAREKAYILEVAIEDYYDGEEQVSYKWQTFDANQKKSVPEHRWKSYDQWFASGWSKIISALKDRITIASGEYQSVMNEMGLGNAAIAEAISNVNNSVYFSKAKSPTGAEFEYPTYNLDGDFSDFVDGTKENLRKDPNHVGFKFGFSSNSGNYSESNTNLGGDGTFSLGGGFAINVGGQWEERSIDIKSKNFSVEVAFSGFREFTIMPGNWYSPLALKLIGNGPWTSKSYVQRWIDQGNEIWGRKGILPLQQVSAYVAIQPTIKVSLATHDYNYYRQAYGGGAGVSFLGIRLGGGGGGHEHIEITWQDNVSSFQIVDRSGKPMLVGIRSVAMPPS